MIDRKSGYYWVKHRDWEFYDIAYWDAVYLEWLYDNRVYAQDHFERVDGRQIIRDDKD